MIFITHAIARNFRKKAIGRVLTPMAHLVLGHFAMTALKMVLALGNRKLLRRKQKLPKYNLSCLRCPR